MGICPWKNWHRKALKIQRHPLSHQNGTKQANSLQLSVLCWTLYFLFAHVLQRYQSLSSLKSDLNLKGKT